MDPKNTVQNTISQIIAKKWHSTHNQLVKFFCNNLFLGQWELAKTCVPYLTKECPMEKDTSVLSILMKTAEYPFSQSFGSRTVPTPHHLSWLCLQQIRELDTYLSDEERARVVKLEHDVDFRLTLSLLSNAQSSSVQELYLYFKEHVLKEKVPSSAINNPETDFLSTTTIGLLRKTMLTSPSLGDSLVKGLTVEEENADNRNNEKLHGISITCMNSLLDEADGSPSQDDIDLLLTRTLEILSFYDPLAYWNYLQIRQLFTRLLTLANAGMSSVLTAESIASAICGRSSTYLLDEFSKIFNEVWMLSVCNHQTQRHAAISMDQQATFELLTQLDRDMCWRDFFISCHKKSVHFLSEILDLCLALINFGKFMELQDLLSYPELQPLKPAVLLMGWSQCVTPAHARTLIDTLWDELYDWPNQSLASSCRSLAYHLDLMQWCMDRAKPLLEGSEPNPSRQASQLLQGLETHSVLYMLHHSTSLASLDHAEVLQLLNNLAVDKKAKNKKKAVTFTDESRKVSTEPINVEQQKDIAIFRGYCAIKNVMDALTFCVDKANHELLNPVQIKNAVTSKRLSKTFLSHNSLSSSEGDDSSSPDWSSGSTERTEMDRESSDNFVASYEESVTQRLKMAKEHLMLLQPLGYRLEVMEDIFSLLFVTSADLSSEGSAVDMETDEETDSKQSSLDNIPVDSLLNMSVISEEDGGGLGGGIGEDRQGEKGKKDANCDEVDDAQDGANDEAVESGQGVINTGIEYDVPFEDSHPNATDKNIPGSEPVKSAYFTLSEEHQLQADASASKQSLSTACSVHKQPSRRRKRVSRESESQAIDIVGFLANEYLTRDILSMLKEALSDFNTAKRGLSGRVLEKKLESSPNKTNSAAASSVSVAIEEALQPSLLTSVQPTTLIKRLSKLTQAVHEAWWRFQLVAHEKFPRIPGQVLTEPVHLKDTDIKSLPVCEKLSFNAEQGLGQLFTTWQAVSPLHLGLQSSIITRMMASPESLLVLCLVKGNLAQAAEVIKLFRLTDKTMETREVGFTDLYRSSAESIWDLEVQGREQSHTPPKVGKRSIKALSKAASVGVATASLSNIVEDLLASPLVPHVPKPRNSPAKESSMLIFSLDPSTALLLDLLFTSCHTWETCSNLLDIIKSKTKLLHHDSRMSSTNKAAEGEGDNSISSQSIPSSVASATSPSSPYSVSTVSGKSVRQIPRQSSLDPALQSITGCSKLAWRLHDLIITEEAYPSSGGMSPAETIMSSGQHQRRSQVPKLSLQYYLHTAHVSLYPQVLQRQEAATHSLRRAVEQAVHVLSSSFSTAKTGAINLDTSFGDEGSLHSPSPSFSGGSYSSAKLSGSSSKTRTSSTASKTPQDKHPLHGAMKVLMYTMEKVVPGDGLSQAHTSNGNKMLATPPAKNYLLSLYEHVKEMAYLVAECEASSKDLTSNYFKVLSDGPVNVLGRLMFVKKMPPAKLEAVAEKLSLNLTHTIVYSCCPKIPSKHPQVLPLTELDVSDKVEGTRVMNARSPSEKESPSAGQDSNEQKEAMHNPEVLVRQILLKLTSKMEAICTANKTKGVFNQACAKCLVQSPDFASIMMGVQEFWNLDLELLRTDAEHICFFVNLANLMLLHCNLVNLQHRFQFGHDLHDMTGTKEEDKIQLFPLAAGDHMGYLSTFSYQLGQLGLVSIYDILYLLCRNGLKPTTQWQGMMNCRKFELSPLDSWSKNSPPTEPRLLFVISHGCASSPPLQILKPDTVEQQLEQAMKSYLCHTVSVSVEQELVVLPELLVWYERDFVTEKKSSKQTPYTGLLKWVSQHVNAEKQQQLQQLFGLDSENSDASEKNDLPFRMAIDTFDNTFSVSFTVSKMKVGLTAGTPLRANNAGETGNNVSTLSSTTAVTDSGLSGLQSSATVGGSLTSLELPMYNLTPVTLEYVKQDSVLAATMVSLVCADNLDNIEQQFTDDHFNLSDSMSSGNHQQPGMSRSYSASLPLPRTSSDISLVDIRSYRYHRLTDDYPVLMRHLLHYILPLASANNPQLLEGRDPILKFVTNDIDDQVKLCMLSLPGSHQFQGVVRSQANLLLEERKWLEMLHILHSLPSEVFTARPELQALHDHVLACWAISDIKKLGYAPKIGDKLRTFYNPSIQARTVLTVSNFLSKDLCCDLLDLCLRNVGGNTMLGKAITNKCQEVQVHGKIVENARALRIKLTARDWQVPTVGPDDQQLYTILEDITDWRRINDITKERPADIITILEKAGDFHTAKVWAELHNLPMSYQTDIKKRQLTYLLSEAGQVDTVKAFQVLEALKASSEQECLSVCRDIAAGLSSPRQIKFVTSFVLRYLTHCLPPDDVEDLTLRLIGSKALLCIPVKLQKDYSHLISCPHLILEQLLMNMKADLAGQIFEEIKSDFHEVREPKLKVSQDQFNNLVTKYANKAIEVTVVTVRASPTPSTSSIGSKLETSVRIASGQRPFSGIGVNGSREGGKFIMPANPPSVQDWVPDSATSVCMVCQIEQFSMFNRRHHCRRCGRVVCASCSTKQTQVYGLMARTCDECYEQIHNTGPNRAQEEHEIYTQRIRDSLSGSSPGFMASTSPMVAGTPSELNQIGIQNMAAAAIHQVDHTWMLSTDTAISEQVRLEFYYEQAPSVSLAVSILKQHSSRTESGKLILSMCDELSSYMVPISPGVPNPEIDYSLIISVMKQLLFQAKIGFQNTGDSGLIDQCDTYLARVDLLGVMVGAHYQDLPTLKELTKMDSVRRLRDKLIADERLSLAMEVSTKCGIDPAGVWSAMGFACLQLGDFVGARDKFAHCLKVPSDKNMIIAGQSRLLKEILDFLDTIPNSGTTEIQRLLRDPESICNIKTLLVPSVGEENRVESVPYKECLFYLRTYGTYMDHITFLRQHNYWMKAVQFSLTHHCSSDVFVTGLMVPAMHSGELGRLLEQMLMLDPSLEKWTPYLTATCKHLLKKKFFYTLYQVQIFMKDYIRAAMTCISHFYQRGATSYLDLSGRLQYLLTAQQHLQAYLDPGQWGSVRHPLAPQTPTTPPMPQGAPSWERPAHSESAARMVLTQDQVKKHIGTITLQVEVTRFMELCITNALGGASPGGGLPTASKSQVPTLFGQGPDRIQLVGLILLSGSDIDAGFDLTIRIIKEFRLNPVLIFTHCSRELAKLGRFQEISTLTQQLVQEGLVDDDGVDEIVGASLLVIADSHNQTRDESDALIQLLRKDGNKINAFILVGKLRSAYLLAVKRERVEDVQRIAGAAQRLNQTAVTNICRKWLEHHKK